MDPEKTVLENHSNPEKYSDQAKKEELEHI